MIIQSVPAVIVLAEPVNGGGVQLGGPLLGFGGGERAAGVWALRLGFAGDYGIQRGTLAALPRREARAVLSVGAELADGGVRLRHEGRGVRVGFLEAAIVSHHEAVLVAVAAHTSLKLEALSTDLGDLSIGERSHGSYEWLVRVTVLCVCLCISSKKNRNGYQFFSPHVIETAHITVILYITENGYSM